MVFNPTPDMTAEAVGPFRSFSKATLVSDALYDALEHPDFGVIPQVVRLRTMQDAISEYALPETAGDEPAPPTHTTAVEARAKES